MSTAILTQLFVSIPAAVAVIVVVMLFLSHLKDERVSRDKWITVMNKMTAAITELTSKLMG